MTLISFCLFTLFYCIFFLLLVRKNVDNVAIRMQCRPVAVNDPRQGNRCSKKLGYLDVGLMVTSVCGRNRDAKVVVVVMDLFTNDSTRSNDREGKEKDQSGACMSVSNPTSYGKGKASSRRATSQKRTNIPRPTHASPGSGGPRRPISQLPILAIGCGKEDQAGSSGRSITQCIHASSPYPTGALSKGVSELEELFVCTSGR